MLTRPGHIEPGAIIGGRYRVDAILGRGGFGIVYRATTIREGHELALKTWTDQTADARTVRRFQQEAEVWIALGSHPHIVQAYRVDILDGRVFIAMEYVPNDGGHPNSVDGWIANGPVDDRTAVEWTIQVCHAMEYAALRGIRSHRDLKPANIMVDAAGRAEITDFGLATHPFLPGGTPELPEIGSAADLFHGQTVRGIGFGTPAYMPPEQFRDAASSDRRTDIYALGMVLCEMLTGSRAVQVPVPDEQSMENRLRWWRAMEEAHLSFTPPDLPLHLAPIVARCVQKQPTDRYPDFAALRHDLEKVAHMKWERTAVQPHIPQEGLDVLFMRAHSLRRLEKWAGAASIYRDIVRRDDTLIQAWSFLGVCLANLDDHKAAEQAHLKAATRAPDHAEVLANWGHARFRAGRTEQAADLFRQALAADPSSAEAHLGRAVVREQESRAASDDRERGMALAEADASARLAVEHNPSLLRAWLMLGRLAARRGIWSEALDAADHVLTLVPQHREATACRACWLVCAGRFDEAMNAFVELRRHGALTPLERLFRAVLYTQTDRFPLAMRDLARATGVAPSAAHALRATTWARLGRWHEAAADLGRTEESLTHPVLATQRAILHHVSGRHAEAATWAAVVRSRHPDFVEAALILAAARMHLGQMDECREVMRDVQPGRPWRDIFAFNMGVVLLARGEAEEALSLYSALSERVEWPDAWHNAGVAAALAGNMSTATRWLLMAHGTQSRPVPVPSPWHAVFRDAAWPLQPEGLAHVLSNGFEPRFRIPLVRPMILLWPAWIPPSMLHSND